MVKRLLACLLGVAIALPLTGCWNYEGLDQLDIVVGIGVDYDKENRLFDVSYDIANLTGAEKKGGISSKMIHAQGKTLADAAANAKRNEADRLFFGTAHVLVLNQQLAREMGILTITETLLREGEYRETMYVVISQEKTAAEILERPEEMSGIMSVTLIDIISEDKDVTGTTLSTQLYQVYNVLNSTRKSILLPVLRRVERGENIVPDINGTAVIRGETLVGFLSPEQSRYALFIEDKLDGGVITLSLSDTPTDDLAMKIFSNKTKKSYTYEENKITVNIKTDTSVCIVENQDYMDIRNKQITEQIEETAARMIEANIKSLVSTMQHEFNADVFGFGEMIYRKDQKLWNQLSPSWDEIYPTVEVEVSAKVEVMNTAFTK
jgi:spore germination protein KC